MTEKYRDICTECGEEKMVWLINEETRLCDECADFLDWIQCDICEDFYPYDSVEFTRLPDGRHVCEYCMEDRESWDES